MGRRAPKTRRARRPNPTARKRNCNTPEWFTFLGDRSQRHRGALKISTAKVCTLNRQRPTSQRHRGALKISTTRSRRHRQNRKCARHNGIEAP